MRVFLSLFLLLAAAACQRETPDVSQNTPSQSSTASGSPVDSPPQSPALDPTNPREKDQPSGRVAASAPIQEVHLIEYAVHMPATLSPGKIAFNIENGGKEDHAFEIEGNGVHHQSEVLKQGGTTSVELDLKPGTYTVYCPVKDHAQKGMKTTITVR